MIGGGGGEPEQEQAVIMEPAEPHDHTEHFHPFSPGAYALYSTLVVAVIGPAFVIWWRKRCRLKNGD